MLVTFEPWEEVHIDPHHNLLNYAFRLIWAAEMAHGEQGLTASLLAAAGKLVSAEPDSQKATHDRVELEKTVENQTEAAHERGTIWHAVRTADLEQVKALVSQGTTDGFKFRARTSSTQPLTDPNILQQHGFAGETPLHMCFL